MKICHLIDDMEIGGAQTHVLTLARAQVAAGHTVTVLSAGGVLERELVAAGVQIQRFPYALAGRGLISNAHFLRKILHIERERQPFDVLHAHTRRTALLLRFLSLPFFPHRSPLPRRIVSAHARFSTTKIYRYASYWGEKTIAVSDDIRRHLIWHFGVPARKIAVIPNGIDRSVFFPNDKRPTGRVTVTFASRLDKDCSMAARMLVTFAPRLSRAALSRGERLELWIVGGGDCRMALKEQAQTITERTPACDIHFPGALLPSEMANQLQKTDIFVGVSRAAMEASLCGCTVLLAGDEGYGGFLREDNFAHFAAGNFCCRDEISLRKERFLRDLLWGISTKDTLLADALDVRRCVRTFADEKQMAARVLAQYVQRQ